MKKKLTALLLLLLSAVALASCSDDAGNDLPETEETRFETANNSPETETITPEPAPITLELTAAEEEEITALFNRMIEYEDIYLFTEKLIGSGKIEEYNKVVDERFDTWEEWTAFVESIYVGDKLERINKTIENDGTFINIDGYTYVRVRAGSLYLLDDFTFFVEERTGDTVTARLNRTQDIPYEGGSVYELYNVYTLQKTDAGWRINDSLSEYDLYVNVD